MISLWATQNYQLKNRFTDFQTLPAVALAGPEQMILLASIAHRQYVIHLVGLIEAAGESD